MNEAREKPPPTEAVMKLEKIEKELEKTLSPKRFRHSAGVAEMARHLAHLYGASEEKAYLAGWIHDCAKEMTLSEMQHVVKKAHLTFDDAKHMLGSRALLHGPAGSVLAKTAFGIDDEEIRGAIYYHTTGRVGMTLLEKIVFLADYIEPNRDFPGVEDLRLLAEKDLDEAVLAAYDSTISHLIDQEAYIYGLTFLGRNDMVEKREKTGR